MDSLTDRTASLLQCDDRRRQLDLLCMIGVHSSVRYAGARPFRQRQIQSYDLTSIVIVVISRIVYDVSLCVCMYICIYS